MPRTSVFYSSQQLYISEGKLFSIIHRWCSISEFCCTHHGELRATVPTLQGLVPCQQNRPHRNKQTKKANAYAEDTWTQYHDLIEYLNNKTDTRVIVLSGVGKHYCAGIDLSEIKPTTDREGLYKHIKGFQKCINAPIEFQIPVISVSHGICYGLGLDIISATTIRICSKDTRFSIKEIDIGIMADIGSLQRLGVIMGNVSKLNEWALTANPFTGEEALKFGIVSDVLETKDAALAKAFDIAKTIEGKYEPAVKGTKKHVELVTNYNDNVVHGLDEVAKDNAKLMSQKEYWAYVKSQNVTRGKL